MVFEARQGPLGDEPDGAAQGETGVQPEGFHQVMLSKPDWVRIRETRMDPYLRRSWRRLLHVLSWYFILIYQGELHGSGSALMLRGGEVWFLSERGRCSPNVLQPVGVGRVWMLHVLHEAAQSPFCSLNNNLFIYISWSLLKNFILTFSFPLISAHLSWGVDEFNKWVIIFFIHFFLFFSLQYYKYYYITIYYIL